MNVRDTTERTQAWLEGTRKEILDVLANLHKVEEGVNWNGEKIRTTDWGQLAARHGELMLVVLNQEIILRTLVEILDKIGGGAKGEPQQDSDTCERNDPCL